MTIMNAGALHLAMEKLRAQGSIDATSLVRETLGRHGLSADALPGLKAPIPDGRARSPDGNARQTISCAAGSREYVLHVSERARTAPKGLLLMLHGCTQTPEDFATGTGMNALADEHGLIVVYPAQARGSNAQSCWNWFSTGDQRRDRGEPAILAGLTQETMQRYGVDASAVFVAGLSAGAAMAVILGQTYPEVFAGVGAHSGLPYGSARDVASAFAAMSGTAIEPNVDRRRSPTPTIVFHGNADQTVRPVNGDRILRDILSATADAQSQIVNDGEKGGLGYCRTTALNQAGDVLAEHWAVDGLGHAWSGGDPRGSYMSSAGPDASAEMVRFFLSLSDDREPIGP